MEYRVETTYGYGNAQALKIASDISSLDLSDAEDILFDFTKYSENNPFSNLLIANSIRTFRKNHMTDMRKRTLKIQQSGFCCVRRKMML